MLSMLSRLKEKKCIFEIKIRKKISEAEKVQVKKTYSERKVVKYFLFFG
jgi:hypothetical protein